jgi:catechol 2,3-dioxygenase
MSPRGCSARSIDHVTVNSFDPKSDAEWYCDSLGLRFMEYATRKDDPSTSMVAFVTPVTNSHQLGLILDFAGLKTGTRMEGRLNHIAYWLDQREDVLRAADFLIDSGSKVEYGPARHGVGENLFLYVREPSGLRVELFSGGYLNAVPDWKPTHHRGMSALNFWTPDIPMPNSLSVGFPPLPIPEPVAK